MSHRDLHHILVTSITNLLNNVDLEKIAQTATDGKKNKATLRKPVKLHGEWNLDPAKEYNHLYFFSSIISCV